MRPAPFVNVTGTNDERSIPMGNAIVHFEIRSEDADATREFYGSMFGWT